MADRTYKAKTSKENGDTIKKPLSAFFIYSGDHRQALRDQNPSWKITDVAKELGRRWKAMSPEEKQTYQERAEEGKAEYARKTGKQ